MNLVRSIINNEKPSPLPEGVTADVLYEIGCKQKMVPMILCALNMISPRPQSENWGKYSALLAAGCMNSEAQMDEYRRIIPYLCGSGMKIIPLKGCVINGLYPSIGLRTMSDVDLLYSGASVKELADLMEKSGYTAFMLEAGCHDTFHKEPNISFELHRKLVVDDSPYRSVLDDMFDKAVPDEEIPNLYHMKPEDLYIHVIVHAAKHFKGGGLGVRPFADIYLINQEYKGNWDFPYIQKQLESVGLERFENKLRELAYAFFGDEVKEVSEEDLAFVFRAGLYGKHHDAAWWYAGKGGKTQLGFYFHRLFMPYASMKTIFPVLVKWPVLLPFAWIYRFFDALLHRRQNVAKVAATKISKEEVDYITRVERSFGLGD